MGYKLFIKYYLTGIAERLLRVRVDEPECDWCVLIICHIHHSFVPVKLGRAADEGFSFPCSFTSRNLFGFNKIFNFLRWHIQPKNSKILFAGSILLTMEIKWSAFLKIVSNARIEELQNIEEKTDENMINYWKMVKWNSAEWSWLRYNREYVHHNGHVNFQRRGQCSYYRESL